VLDELAGLLLLPGLRVVAMWLGLTLVRVDTATYGLRLDAEFLHPLWTLPLPLIGYGQPMCLVAVQSTVTGLAGRRLRWHPVTRTGATREAVESHPSG